VPNKVVVILVLPDLAATIQDFINRVRVNDFTSAESVTIHARPSAGVPCGRDRHHAPREEVIAITIEVPEASDNHRCDIITPQPAPAVSFVQPLINLRFVKLVQRTDSVGVSARS
jgi:hypothetical protein